MSKPTTHRAAVKALVTKIRTAYPEAQYIGGTGYCGPDWAAAQAMWEAGLAAIAHLTDDARTTGNDRDQRAFAAWRSLWMTSEARS